MTEHRVPRRTFLTTAAATVAGATLGASRLARAADAPAPSPMRANGAASPSAVRLGVASYSLRKFPLDKSISACNPLDDVILNFPGVTPLPPL